MIWLTLIVGLVMLIAGGELLVRGGVATAQHLRVSPLMIGLTVVAFGTSSPELVASVTAATKGASGIAIGNVIGSNIANILLIIGGAAVITPMLVTRRAFARDSAALIGATVATIAATLAGYLSRFVGVLFLVALTAFIAFCYVTERMAGDSRLDGSEPVPAGTRLQRHLPLALLLVIVGLAALAGGATLLVDGAVDLARLFGISDAVIGLTIVAIGTSLPEFATTIIAAFRGRADVAIGNVIGSNIFNCLCILGITAVVQPIPVPPEIAHVDVWVMLGATVLFIGLVASGWKIRRWEGALLLGGYVAYLSYLVLTVRMVA